MNVIRTGSRHEAEPRDSVSVVTVRARGMDGVVRVFSTLHQRGIDVLSATIGEPDRTGEHHLLLRVDHGGRGEEAVAKVLNRIVTTRRVTVREDAGFVLAFISVVPSPNCFVLVHSWRRSSVRVRSANAKTALLEFVGTGAQLVEFVARFENGLILDVATSGPLMPTTRLSRPARR